ncbi:hypothetical protein DXG01_015208 [Tephrocybe rancida]|nr:hypothetical protein DXG01_015208 [Tephrocybe rancida]
MKDNVPIVTERDYFEPLNPDVTQTLSSYVQVLSGEMEKDLKNLTSAFQLFHTHGIPSLQYEEKRETDVLISLSTVGSLLSAVTVTALQISLGTSSDISRPNLIAVVNSLWFASLVLSIGSALNSLLSVSYKRTPYILTIIAWFAYERWVASVLSNVMGEAKPAAELSKNPYSVASSMVNPANLSRFGASDHYPPISTTLMPGPSAAPFRVPDPDIEALNRAPFPRLARTVGVLNVLRRAFRLASRADDGGLLDVTGASSGAAHPKFQSPFEMAFPVQSKRTLSAGGTIEDIQYSPNGSLLAIIRNAADSWTGFLIVEQNSIVEMKLDGHVGEVGCLANMVAQPVSLGNSPTRIEGSIASGRRSCPQVNLTLDHWSLTSAQGQYARQQPLREEINLHQKRIIRQIPFLDDIRHVRIARTVVADGGGLDILLSLKNEPSSMLWTLKLYPEPILEPCQTQQVLMAGSQSVAPELAGHAYFVGEQDQMIACRGSDGDIHLWDRKSGFPVHRIPAKTSAGSLRSFAWRPSPTQSVTFASVHNRELKIWTSEELPTIPGSQATSINGNVKPSRAPSIAPSASGDPQPSAAPKRK